MNPKSLFVIILCLAAFSLTLNAQDKSERKLSKITPADFSIPSSPLIDTSTSAVILSSIGSTNFTGNTNGGLSYVFKKQVRIRIINKRAIEALSTIIVQLYAREDRAQKLTEFSGTTYNLEDGGIFETKLDKNSIFETRLDKNLTEKKFTLPAVKVGSIIEYSYTIVSDFDFNLPSWEFQSADYPCLWSEYSVEIPITHTYVMIRQGVHSFAVDKASMGEMSYLVTEHRENGVPGGMDENLHVSAPVVKNHWVMKDIPAFHMDSYISSPRNYIDEISFQLSKYFNGQDSTAISNTWKQATQELLERENFGEPLRQNNGWLDHTLEEATAGPATGDLGLARSIYYYVTGHFTCTDYDDKYISTRLQDVVQKHKGSVGDINLLLTTMLRKAGFEADPVVLSTRGYGFNLASYPVLARLNYVIVRVKIDGKVYYLDAAHRYLGFGQLNEDCYNGHARIICQKDSGSVYFYPDSLKENKVTLVLITSDEKGAMMGSYQSTTGYPGSADLRETLNEEGQTRFFKDIQTSYGEDLTISNTGIDSLDKPEMPVKVYYEFKLNQEPGAALIYFSPMVGEGIRENPFTAEDRKYPVEMLHAFDHTYLLTMDIPTGYAVEELPKSTRVALNGDDGLFEYLLSADTSTIQMRVHVKLNRATFLPEDYNNLRQFYIYVVKKESEQIVLKKKK